MHCLLVQVTLAKLLMLDLGSKIQGFEKSQGLLDGSPSVEEEGSQDKRKIRTLVRLQDPSQA